MDRAELFLVMTNVLSDEFAADPAAVVEGMDLERDLDIDSLDMVQLLTALEYRLKTAIPDAAFGRARTVGDLMDAIIKNA